MQTLLLDDTIENIRLAGNIIRRGGLVAFPTETVYGLGADALNRDAVKKVYLAKGRPSDNPMIVHIQEPEELKSLTREITDDMKMLMGAFWPGPMTMVVRRDPKIPDTTTGGLDTVGIRLPSNPTARALIRESGKPIAAPSANLSGRPSPTSYRHVVHDLDGKIDAILKGEDARFGIESSVIDMTGPTPVILRPGAITAEMFARALGKPVTLDPTLNQKPDGTADFHPRAPGMKYKHYAPEAAMTIYQGTAENTEAAMREDREALERQGKRVMILAFDPSPTGEEEAAHELFRRLRAADEEGFDWILARALPQEGMGFSVMNRMLRSAGFHIKEV